MPSSLAPATPDRDSRGGASIADHLPIIRPALILTAAFLGSRLLGLARDVAIGAQFGTTRDLDLYIAAFRLPDFIFNLLAGGALGSALVPVFARTLTQTQREALWRLVSAVATLMILSCGGAALILAAVAPWVVPVNTTTSGGKLIFHVFGALAEFERDLIGECTTAGLATVRRRCSKLGRPRSLTPEQGECMGGLADEGSGGGGHGGFLLG